ncbi:MAG: DNA (cytosine-5-)-methyltransferase [Pelobium sp.]
MSEKFKVGSLYAGVGGICQGFIAAGIQVAWANEIDKYACVTYRNNFSHPLYEGDIWSLDPKELDAIDILTGGFPCQPFSIAGYRKGFEDDRGNHFNRIIQFAKVLQPKAMLLENVKNLTSHDKGNTFKVIMETLNAIGYAAYARVLNSKDFGNIPQNRERIYIVAFKRNENGEDEFGPYFNFPEPVKLNNSVIDYLEEKVDEKYYYREDKYNHNELKKSMTSSETVYQWRRHYVRENKQNVCPTLTANMGTGGHNVPLILVRDGIRKLTPTECFKLQGFGNDFKLPETISSAQLYKQAGNSVTVSVIKRIAENIKKALEAV